MCIWLLFANNCGSVWKSHLTLQSHGVQCFLHKTGVCRLTHLTFVVKYSHMESSVAFIICVSYKEFSSFFPTVIQSCVKYKVSYGKFGRTYYIIIFLKMAELRVVNIQFATLWQFYDVLSIWHHNNCKKNCGNINHQMRGKCIRTVINVFYCSVDLWLWSCICWSQYLFNIHEFYIAKTRVPRMLAYVKWAVAQKCFIVGVLSHEFSI